jgi:hypothetical protein
MAIDPFSRNVFINCPFDEPYRPLFQAAVFAIFDCGFRPRCALEVIGSGRPRIEKIVRIIKDCRLGIHDISRTEPDPKEHLPRFNMPLELGLFLGAQYLGTAKQKKKECLVLDREPYRYQKYCSDIAGQDIEAHSDEPTSLIRIVRNWLHTLVNEETRFSGLDPGLTVIAGDLAMIERYDVFCSELPALCATLGLSGASIVFTNLEGLVAIWIENNPWRPIAP